MIRVMRYRMYLKYTTGGGGGRNAKKKYIKFKIK